MSRATKSQQDLTGKNLRELSTTLPDMAKHVKKPRLTSSDVESPSKRQRFNFIAYKNMSSEEESSLKHFDNTFRPPLLSTTLQNVVMTSQSQPTEMNWMRQQMAQMQIMMKQMSRSQCSVNPIELE